MPDPSIFISYRRYGDAPYAGRIHDALRRRFGSDRVFMDLGGIEYGERFDDVLARALASCVVFLAIIGPHWSAAKDSANNRRLNDPQDWVRREIETALTRAVTVIPVLVGGTAMPEAASLPPSMRALVVSQALEMSEARWTYDVRVLSGRLAALVPEPWWWRIAYPVVSRRNLVVRALRGLALAVAIALGVIVGFHALLPYVDDPPGLVPGALATGAFVALAVDWAWTRLRPRAIDE